MTVIYLRAQLLIGDSLILIYTQCKVTKYIYLSTVIPLLHFTSQVSGDVMLSEATGVFPRFLRLNFELSAKC